MKEKITLANLLDLYENRLCKSIKNKSKLLRFENFKMININSAYNILKNGNYNGGTYNIFIIRRPKYRIVMSLNIVDKIVNHFLCDYVLIPKLSHRLDNKNVATRKDLGTKEGIKLVKKYIEQMKKYKNFYVLKMDVHKYFYSIDHEILKGMLISYLDEYEYEFMCNIINSTNDKSINKTITKLINRELKYNNIRRKEIESIPLYEDGKGLPIGNLTSQFLAIYYLNELDHYIIHDLKLPKFVRYMDDFLIFSEDKEKLKDAYTKIEKYLNDKLRLKLNHKKSNIHNVNDGFLFLGYRFRIINNKTVTTIAKETKTRIKKRIKEVKFLYSNDYVNFNVTFSSVITYLKSFKYGSKLWVKRNIDKYFFN